LQIAADREKDYVGHFQQAKQGRDMACFFSRAAARIAGRFDPEPDLRGLRSQAMLF